MKNEDLSVIFARIADLLEFKGEMIFKVNAYRKASRVLYDLHEDIEQVWKEGRLAEIPGVGKGIQGKIEEYLASGKIAEFDKLYSDIPKGLFDLLSIQNFGPRTAALAFKHLHVQTVEDLEKVIADGSLATLPGMGEKKVENIRKSLELKKTAESQISIGYALPLVDAIIGYLKEKCGPKLGQISAAGSVRRYKETVHDIDLLAETEHIYDVVQEFVNMPRVTRILGAGETKGSVIIDERVQVDLRAVKSESFGAAQQYFTGSQAHNIKLRGIAKKRGYKINEYGIFKGDTFICGRTEDELYHQLGMDWIPPEMREDRGEIEAAHDHLLPSLIELKDLQADLHIHSTYSDGHLTLREMSEKMRAMGYSYMAFCDHSKFAIYANGLSEERLKTQAAEIDELNKEFTDFRILKGIEVDILPDGSLDFSNDVLQKLDFVIASIHSAFKTNPTGRTIAAMQNPYVDVIGHPTGRIITRREGYELDMDKVIDAAAETGTAMEVNSFWDRLDLSDLHVRQAISKNIKISINTDSHHTNHLPMIMFGVGMARRGWAQKNDVINAMKVEDLRKWQKRNRS